MALPTKEERIRRKKVMLASGISVPNTDDSWGPWWDELWKKAITHTKTNDNYYGRPNPINFIHRTWDNITGNTTYEAEPLPIGGTILATDMSMGALAKRTLNNWKHSGDPARDITLLLMPDPSKLVKAGKATVQVTPALVKAAPKTVKATFDATKKLFTGQVSKESIKEGVKNAGFKTANFIVKEVPKFVAGYVGGQEVDKVSEAITGKSWAENATDKMSSMAGFHIEPIFGELTNPGYIIGPAAYDATINGAKQAVMNLNYSIPFLTNNLTLREGFGLLLNKFGLGTGFQNIRYRNGIRDYFGNVLSKYSTIVPRPSTVFSGNLLELARKRVLDNLEKYGIKDTDYVHWTTAIDDPNLLQLSKSIGFEIPSYNLSPFANNQVTVTMPAKTYLEHISPIEGVEAAFRPRSATIFHQNSGYVEDIQKLYPEFADAHEFSHAIDWVLHNKTTTIPKTNGIHILLDNSLKDIYKLIFPESGSKIDLTKNISEINVPGLNYSKIKLNIGTLKYHRLPTELKARYELIRNWLGITDERPLTLTEWNLAKRYYTSSVGDNNMQEFFKLVENPEEFINWASKRYSTNYNGSVVSNASIERLPRNLTPVEGSSYYPFKVNHDDELPGFLDMIQELAGGKAPLSETSGLTTYAMPKPSWQLTPSERPKKFNGLRTAFRRLDPETITAGDLAYVLAHNLENGWDREAYKGILKDTRIPNFDYEESARALMYDVKAQLYKKLIQQNGGKSLTADEFAYALLDLTRQDFSNAFKRAHGGMYRRDRPLTFDIENLSMEDLNRIIDLLTKYKNGGKFYKKDM